MDVPRFVHVAESLSSSLAYEYLRYVACGAFKETYEVKAPDGTHLALKIMDPSKCNLCRNEREINSMKRCQHPGIGRLINSGETILENDISYFFSIEEFFDGGSLADRIKGNFFPVNRAVTCGRYLACALEHLASMNLVHRDIKPENIMFRSGADMPILVDFGLVRDLAQSSLTQTWLPHGPCTPFYAAPEQLNNDKDLIDWRTDQFALGVVICYCMTGRHPYEQTVGSSTVSAIEHVATRGEVGGWFKTFVRTHSIGFVEKMLHPWPNRRFIRPADLIEAFGVRD